MTLGFLNYAVSPFLLTGAWLALQIAAVALVAGLLLGLGLALLRLSRNPVVSGAAWFYIWVIRGTPLLLQLVFIFDVLPAIGLTFGTFTTAVIGFSLNEAAFTAEIIRGGIVSVNRSQSVAATSLGLPPFLTLRRIVLPQAMRVILPPIGNEVISMVKLTSIASVIQYAEILRNAQTIYFANARVIELLIVAAFWYLAVVTVLSVGQYFIEKHFARGVGTRRLRPTLPRQT